MTQSEINILSQYMVELANMERHLLEYRIWNQSNYDKIEKAFTADCEAWEKQADAEAKKLSETAENNRAETISAVVAAIAE